MKTESEKWKTHWKMENFSVANMWVEFEVGRMRMEI